MNFQETENKVPVTAQELIGYVKHQLSLYDAYIATHKTQPAFNPYTHPMTYKTGDGRTIRVPDDIQKRAISLWYQEHGTNVSTMQQMPQTEYVPKPKESVVYEIDEGETDYIRLAILVFVAVFALYLYFKSTKTPKIDAGSRYMMVR